MLLSKDNTVILLSSCVNPGAMLYTKVIDKNERMEQYLSSLDYYIRMTKFRIVLVDNSKARYSEFINESDRLELLSFDGNHFDHNLGKGYGEGEVLRYAFENSRFVKSSDNVIKISGRHIVTNINSIIKLMNIRLLGNTKHICCDFAKQAQVAVSDVLVAPNEFYLDYLLQSLLKCNDLEGIYFEHILYNSVSVAISDGYKHLPFPLKPHQIGVSGTTGQSFSNLGRRGQLQRLFCFFTGNDPDDMKEL